MELNVSYLAKEYENGWSLWIIRSDGRRNLIGSAIKDEGDIDDLVGGQPIQKEKLEKVDLNMNQVAAVKFDNPYNNKVYNFLTDIKTLKEGDKVVVDSTGSFQVATFVTYRPDVDEGSVKKWVIQKVDLNKYNERNQKEIKEKIKVYENQLQLRIATLLENDDHILSYKKSIESLKNKLH